MTHSISSNPLPEYFPMHRLFAAMKTFEIRPPELIHLEACGMYPNIVP